MSELLEIIENFDNVNLIKNKQKEYKKNWIMQNKDKIILTSTIINNYSFK